MNLRQFIPVMIVLAAAMILVWRSSGKKPSCGCGSDCSHDHEGKSKDMPKADVLK
jgi:hypothetical protein